MRKHIRTLVALLTSLAITTARGLAPGLDEFRRLEP